MRFKMINEGLGLVITADTRAVLPRKKRNDVTCIYKWYDSRRVRLKK